MSSVSGPKPNIGKWVLKWKGNASSVKYDFGWGDGPFLVVASSGGYYYPKTLLMKGGNNSNGGYPGINFTYPDFVLSGLSGSISYIYKWDGGDVSFHF